MTAQSAAAGSKVPCWRSCCSFDAGSVIDKLYYTRACAVTAAGFIKMGRDKTVGHVTNAFALVISMGTIMLLVALFGLLGACCSGSPLFRLPLIAGAMLPPPPPSPLSRAFITLAPLSWAHMTPELGSSHYCTAQAIMTACTPRQPHVPSTQNTRTCPPFNHLRVRLGCSVAH